jgi:hypothetical protein
MPRDLIASGEGMRFATWIAISEAQVIGPEGKLIAGGRGTSFRRRQ